MSNVFTRHVREKAHELKRKLEQLKNLLPKDLSKNPDAVSKMLKQVLAAENFLRESEDFELLRWKTKLKIESTSPHALSVTTEASVLKLANAILVEGPPGCGKTTFLRRLASQLLKSGAHVIFVLGSYHSKDNKGQKRISTKYNLKSSLHKATPQ